MPFSGYISPPICGISVSPGAGKGGIPLKICPLSGKPCLQNQCALYIVLPASSGSACAFVLMAESLRATSRELTSLSDFLISKK
jgi:hypothetical protein